LSELRTLTPGRWALTQLGLLALLAAAALTAVFAGLPRIDPVRALLEPEAAAGDRDILLMLRLPRILAGAVAGGSLAICGAVLQAILRNPLAYPHILGISGGAAVGGIAARLFGFSVIAVAGASLPGASVTAFLVALGATFLVYRTACVRGRLEPVTLILVGVVFNSFAAALILFLFAAADMRQAQGILFWMIGSLDLVDLGLLYWASAIALCGSLYLATLARSLNALTLGDEVAAGLGVSVDRVRVSAFVATSLVVGAVVSLCGMIGFVGLIVPHLLRLVLGSDHRLLLPASFLGGAVFLILADLLSRTILYPVQLPVGVLTAFCGGPFFLYLLRRHRGRTLSHG
jgi:iron complex transport system permease protein